MIITNFQTSQYSIPFKQTVSIKGHTLKVREGIFLTLQANGIIEGRGEIAPLPGLSKETLKEVQEQLKSLKFVLLNQEIPEGIECLDGKFAQWFDGLELSPSVCFGVEMALLNLIAKSKKKPFHKLISKDAHNKIQINGLLQGTTETLLKKTKTFISNGFKAVKLKVGGDVQDSVKRVTTVNTMLNGRALLHLDANQTWKFDKALEFMKIIEDKEIFIDYIEEPFKDISRIPEFFHETSIPVALDETLHTHCFEEIKSIEGVEFLILKPTLLGGIEKTWGLMQKAQRLAIRTVISSSFESPHGILTLAALAANIPHNPCAGLDTLKYFEDKAIEPQVNFECGTLDLNAYL